MQSVNKIPQEQQDFVQLDAAQLEKPLNPRKSNEFLTENKFSSDYMLGILADRANIYKAEQAFLVLDSKGKEVSSITWEKLYHKAVKIAYEIHNKLSMKNSDTVVLLYKEGEVGEFASSLFGCFLAGVTAIPIHQDISLHEVLDIINLTSTKLLLFSETVSKELDKMNAQSQQIVWPSKLMRWRTTDLGRLKSQKLSIGIRDNHNNRDKSQNVQS